MGVTGGSGGIMLNELLKVKVTEFEYIYMILVSTCDKPNYLKSGAA